jgi:ergothioneine biosynthesis protein EgtB
MIAPTLPELNARADIRQAYRDARSWTEHLCAPLDAVDFVAQPIVDVSPPKWHLGHTTWFFETLVLREWIEDYVAFEPQFNYIFNSYYESLGPRIHRSRRGNLIRPPLEAVLGYRRHVDERIEQLLERFDGRPPQALHTIIELGIHHEQQHQELLLTDIKYIYGHNPLFPSYQQGGTPAPARATREARWLDMPEGLYDIGHRGPGFCFDNELGAHQVYLHAYRLQDRLTTNGEYLAFLLDGGYERPEFWLSEGWDWVGQLETKAPLYWFEQAGQWFHYTLWGLTPLALEAPVTHLSYYEAEAFARWKGLRLPTEFEWEAACRRYSDDNEVESNFVERGLYHPAACAGLDDYQLRGHVWEWTNSAYLPYPYFPRLEGPLGEYNGKFMVNQMVLRGGSCATPRSHYRPSYRNFFHADKRWQFTGIRLAEHTSN